MFFRQRNTLSKEVSRVASKSSPSSQLNQQLLNHFISLNEEYSDEDEVDFEFLNDLVTKGADINAIDIYGQTILHEAAREWSPDVAKFIVQLGGNVQATDYFGRAPLHFASANDHTDMISYLISQGADVNIRIRHDSKHCTTVDPLSSPQNQTPLHMAAGSDAKEACKVLIEAGAEIEAADYRGRTPLFIAAELDRSVTAKYLLEQGANATTKDNFGNMAITIMGSKMPQVCAEALDQLYAYNRSNRNQYFFISKLVPSVDEYNSGSRARNILEIIVKEQKLDLINHTVIQKFIR